MVLPMDSEQKAPPDSMAGRLAEAFEHRKRTEGLTRVKLADMVKMRNNSVGEILRGETEPGAENLNKIMLALRVWPSYVMLGIPPKYFEDSDSALQPVTLPPVMLGIDQYLAAHPEVSAADAAWLRAFPWKDPDIRQPDAVYLMVLAAHQNQMGRDGQESHKKKK